jgi:hypothetical protein
MEKGLQKKMLSPAQVAELYSISPGSLANWRSLKRGPKFYKISRKVLYRVEDCEDFFTANPVLTVDSLPENQQ